MKMVNRSALKPTGTLSRRQMLRTAAMTAPAAFGAACLSAPLAADEAILPDTDAGPLNQSIVFWCFAKYWGVEKACRIANQLGCKSVELVEPKFWPMLKREGLVCALAGSHGFIQGMNHPKYQDTCLAKMRESIDRCAEFGFPNVITFTGLSEDLSAEEGKQNCVDGYKRIIGHAERQGVNICLEMLNSRVPIDMVGVPGYQGDHTDYCVDIVRQVGSPRMKLLFDVFHVQIMDGDIISRIRQFKDDIGHYHTAGNPGRHELNDTQEINYRPIFRAIAETNFDGYVGHEFIPAGDPLEGLKEAVKLCAV